MNKNLFTGILTCWLLTLPIITTSTAEASSDSVKRSHYYQVSALLSNARLHKASKVMVIDGTEDFFLSSKVSEKLGATGNLVVYGITQPSQTTAKHIRSSVPQADFKTIKSVNDIALADTYFDVIISAYALGGIVETEQQLQLLSSKVTKGAKLGARITFVDFSSDEQQATKESLKLSRVNRQALLAAAKSQDLTFYPEKPILHNELDAKDYDARFEHENLYPDRFILKFRKPYTTGEEIAGW